MRYAKNAIRNRTGLRVANARRKGQGSSEELGAGVYFGVHSPVTLSGPANRPGTRKPVSQRMQAPLFCCFTRSFHASAGRFRAKGHRGSDGLNISLRMAAVEIGHSWLFLQCAGGV
jgi:hypothetical protein